MNLFENLQKLNEKVDINIIKETIKDTLYQWYHGDEYVEGNEKYFYWDYAYDVCKNAPNEPDNGIIDSLYEQVSGKLDVDIINDIMTYDEFLKLVQSTVNEMDVDYLYTWQKKYDKAIDEK